MDEVEDKQSSYAAMSERFQQARDRLSLGYQTLKEENSYSQLQSRAHDRLKTWGLRPTDYNSAFDRYEQISLDRGDAMSKIFQRSANIGFGGAQLGINAIDFLGIGSTKFGNTAGIASMAANTMGMGGTSATLGKLASVGNWVTLPLQIGLGLMQGGFQNSVIDPYANIRTFEATTLGNLRQTLGGTQSNRGFGGIDMPTALNTGKTIQDQIAWNNKGISAVKINEFLNAATQMPQLQYVQNADQAINNINKFMDMFVKLSKQFKGKDKEIITAFQQFGQMGMTLNQSEQAFTYGTRMGQFLNVSPNNITMAGANAVQQAMNSGQIGGIQQGTVYNLGTNNYTQAERMKQSGALTPLQLQNFGGTEGVANILSSSQLNFLKSGASNMFLKAIYDPTSEDGINKDMLKQIVSGKSDLGAIRQKAMEVTLNPKANMDFGLQKDFIIGKLGDDINKFNYAAWDTQFANKSPFGKDLTGRAKWLQVYQNMDSQTALLNAQAWMSHDPLKEAYLQEQQYQQNILSNDPYYSSQSNLMVGVNTGVRNLGRLWDTTLTNSAWSPFSYFNSASRPYAQFWNTIGGGLRAAGSGNISDLIFKASTPKPLEEFKPFSQFTDPKEANKTWTEILNSQDRGYAAWSGATKKLEDRKMAVLLSSNNAFDLIANKQDKNAVKETINNFMSDFSQNLANKYGEDEGIKNHFQNISAEDAEKEIRSAAQNYMKGRYDTDAYKKIAGENGMFYNFEDIAVSDAMNKVLPKEKLNEIKDSILKSSSSYGLSIKNPYEKQTNHSLKRSSQVFGYGATGMLALGAASILITGGLSLPVVGAAALGYLGGTMAGNMILPGSDADEKRVAGFVSKFDDPNLSNKDKLKMYHELESVSKYKNPEEILSSQRDMLGLSADISMQNIQDLLSQIGNIDQEGSPIRNVALMEGEIAPHSTAESNKVSEMRKKENQINLSKGFASLYGSGAYQEKAESYNANKDFFKNFFGKMQGHNELSTSISEGDWGKMKKDLKNKAGWELFSDKFTVYENGQVRPKTQEELDAQGLTKQYEKARLATLTHDMGKAENYNIQSAERIWNNRGNEVKTIQDFAVAVAKGIDIARTGGADLNQWIKVVDSKDSLQTSKMEKK